MIRDDNKNMIKIPIFSQCHMIDICFMEDKFLLLIEMEIFCIKRHLLLKKTSKRYIISKWRPEHVVQNVHKIQNSNLTTILAIVSFPYAYILNMYISSYTSLTKGLLYETWLKFETRIYIKFRSLGASSLGLS